MASPSAGPAPRAPRCSWDSSGTAEEKSTERASASAGAQGQVPWGPNRGADPLMIIPVADGFWNIRGPHRIGGILDVGTHASLVRRASGAFVFLDSYTMAAPVKREL